MFKQYRKIDRNEFIVAGADTASGGHDYSACQFLSKTKLDVPLVWHSQLTTTEMTNAIHPVLERTFDVTGVPPVVCYERNAGGSFEMDRLAHLNRYNKYRLYVDKLSQGTLDQPEAKKYGWTTSTATRPKMLEDLKNAIDNHLLRIYDKATVNELYSFIVVKTSSSWKAQAESNAHDDLVMSLAIAWQVQQLHSPLPADIANRFPKQELFDKYGISNL